MSLPWVVDTCVVIDVLEADPRFGEASARLLAGRLSEGLILCPITYVELGAAFDGDESLQNTFIDGMGVGRAEPWTAVDSAAAMGGWARYVRMRRTSGLARRPVADVLIGAFACRFAGIITRNPSDFSRLFPSLQILDPTPPAKLSGPVA